MRICFWVNSIYHSTFRGWHWRSLVPVFYFNYRGHTEYVNDFLRGEESLVVKNFRSCVLVCLPLLIPHFTY